MKQINILIFAILCCNGMIAQQFGESNFLTNEYNSIAAVKSSDINNDGLSDIIMYKYYELVWYENNGDNSYTEHFITSVTNAQYSSTKPMEVADIDNDGLDDIIINGYGQNYQNSYYIRWYRNLGNGNFSSANILYGTNNPSSRAFALAIGDLNGDGLPEIIGSSSFSMVYYENLGNGNFAAYSNITEFEDVVHTSEIIISDMDGDQRPDLLIGRSSFNANSSIVWYRNNGNGTFDSEQAIQMNDFCQSVNAIDIDCDGDNDIFASLYENDSNAELFNVGEIVFYENLGNGNFGSKHVIEDHVGLIRHVELLDLDNDYDPDLVIAGDEGKLDWYVNSDGLFSNNSIPLTLTETDRVFEIHFVDLDNDNDQEMVAIYENSRSCYWFENLDVPTTAKDFGCTSFENCTSNWINLDSDDLDWERESWGTPSWATGPSFAIDGNYYYYVESSAPNFPAKDAILESANTIVHPLTEFLTFKYHMRGYQMGGIKVSISTNDGLDWTQIWDISGNQGNEWHSAVVDISAYQNQEVKFRITGITGIGSKSDMAIDLLCLSPRVEGCMDINSCNYDPYANIDDGSCYYCTDLTFENGLDGWSNMENYDFDLTVWSGNTPSNLTGPSSAYEGYHYIYAEASFPNYPSKKAAIVSPCTGFNRYADLWYHMNGKNCGTLRFRASIDGGETWLSILKKTGSQGNEWKYSGIIDLLDYFPEINYSNQHLYELIFSLEITTGNGYVGDIAVDLIRPGCASDPEDEFIDLNNREKSNTKTAELMHFNISPNPVFSQNDINLDIMNIDESINCLELSVYNEMGSLVISRSINTEYNSNISTTLQNEGLTSGLYLIAINSGKVKLTQKLIIQD